MNFKIPIKNCTLWILLILSISFSYSVLASHSYQPKFVNPLAESWRWKHFPELEGKGIRNIVESDDQTVWVSSNEGVLEYDGYSWKVHNPENGLHAISVEQIIAANDGSIYVTASNGIFRFNNQKWEQLFSAANNCTFIFHAINQLKNNSIIASADWGFIHFLTNGNVYFYSSLSKIEQLKDDYPDIKWVTLPDSALSGTGDFLYGSDVLETNSGELWFAIATEEEVGKLLRFRSGDEESIALNNYVVYGNNDGFELGEEQKLLQAKDNRIWIINNTSYKGILIYDGKSWESIFLNDYFGADEYLTDIVQSDNGTIWLSSLAKIYAYNDGHWNKYKAPNYPVPANMVVLEKSKSDHLWVAGYRSRVFLLDLSTDHWLTYGDLSFQCEISPEEQWFLERNNSIVHRKDNVWTSFNTEDGLMDAPIRVFNTSKGQVWVAGSHQGKAATAVLKDGKWELFTHSKLSWGVDYRSVFEAKDGSLWFGGAVDADEKDGFLGGVLQLQNPIDAEFNWIHHRFNENGLDQRNCYGIGQSKDGVIWIGGSNLYFYDGKTWNTLPDARLQQFVNCVASTDELLLVGSRYYGLFVYDGNTWKNHTTASGLSGNTIISIDVLSDSVFIVATENSISKFDGSTWINDIFPTQLDMDFEGGSIFHTSIYIWINHVPRSWKRRAFQNPEMDQNMSFFTTRYRPQQSFPKTIIDFYTEQVDANGNCIISWTGNDYFSITPSEKLMYSYRIDDVEWSTFKSDKQHTFTNLPSGIHTLEVRSRDLDLNIDPTPAKIQFEVLPPIWMQSWFIALILTFAIILGTYEYRLISRKRKLEILNTSLGQANIELKERGQQIEKKNQEILIQQEQILEQSKVLVINNQDLESRNEKIRQQRDKLEEMVAEVENLSKAKVGFFTNISHELRTPLTLILGPVAQLKSGNNRVSASQQQQFYDIIDRNASRLLKLINQLLEMRLIEHSTLELRLSNIYLTDYLSHILELFEELANRRNISLSYINNTDIKLVSIDYDKVEKIIVNLLANAFNNSSERGKITLTLNKVPAENKKLQTLYESYFEIIVEDTGCGIDPDEIDYIFDKYFTSKSKIDNTHHTGIGLSYTRDLVYLMQGDIRVKSIVKKGTSFYVYIPFIEKRQVSSNESNLNKPLLKVAQQEASYLLGNLKVNEDHDTEVPFEDTDLPSILLVEDNQDMLNFLETIFHEKYTVTTAVNGLLALKAAEDFSYDLIISDVMMPEMDGITFCEQIKDNLITSHIPVILLTARVLDESKIAGYKKGADDYITKPFSPDLLLARVENLLEQRKSLQQFFNKEFKLTPKTETLESPDEIFLNKLVDLINENLVETEFNVDYMCKSMHLSHMHFIRKVKQLTGKKPIDLLKSFRMKKARDLLAQDKLTISEVAYKVGFDLPNSFSRSFKKEYGQTPTEFVNTLKDNHSLS